MKHVSHSGVSLIELVVVIVIILVVLSIGGCFTKAIDQGGVKGGATTLWEGTNKVSEPSTE